MQSKIVLTAGDTLLLWTQAGKIAFTSTIMPQMAAVIAYGITNPL